MSTQNLIKSVTQSKGNSALVKAMDNANEEAIKQDRKDAPKVKGK